MRRHAGLVLFLLAAAAQAAAGVEDARRLLAEGRLGPARASLEALLAEDPGPGHAEALALLGAIAVREGDLAAAAEAWSDLEARFPGSPEALQAAAGLSLLGEVRECRGQPPAPERTAVGTPVETPPAAPALPVEVPAIDDPAVEAPPVQDAPAAPGATDAPAPAATPAPGAAGTVLVAGDGSPPEVIEEVVGLFVTHLRERGVEAAVPPSPLWWRRSWEMSEPGLLQAAREAGSAGVLWIDMRFGFRERLRARCFEAGGGKALDVRAAGGSYYTDHRPNDAYNLDLVERVQRKMAEHVGGRCLPATR